MKIKLLMILFAVALVIGCAPQEPSGQAEPADAAAEDAGSVTTEAAGATVINVRAMQWRFDPQEIVVSEGDNVELRIESVDVRHGFSIPGYNINEMLKPGSEVVINFVADKKGVFAFACSVPCGSGHSGMRGTLVVE